MMNLEKKKKSKDSKQKKFISIIVVLPVVLIALFCLIFHFDTKTSSSHITAKKMNARESTVNIKKLMKVHQQSIFINIFISQMVIK